MKIFVDDRHEIPFRFLRCPMRSLTASRFGDLSCTRWCTNDGLQRPPVRGRGYLISRPPLPASPRYDRKIDPDPDSLGRSPARSHKTFPQRGFDAQRLYAACISAAPARTGRTRFTPAAIRSTHSRPLIFELILCRRAPAVASPPLVTMGAHLSRRQCEAESGRRRLRKNALTGE